MNEEFQRPYGTLVTAVILAVSTLWLGMRMPRAIESFRELFKEFGADLPPVTRMVLAVPNIWWLFAALAFPLLAWVIARQRITRDEFGRMKLAVRSLLIITLLAYAFAAYAIYLPIFRLGAVV